MQSMTARLMREAAAIVWDEAPTGSKAIFNAVDMLCQDIMRWTKPFGGKVLLLGGDFRQIPPVLRYVDRDVGDRSLL